MVRRMAKNYSELWKKLPWKKFRRELFRLQVRLFKAIRANDTKRARNLQKLILKSRCARFLAIRQVTQLNAGKKTAGIDGKKSLSFLERLELETTLRLNVCAWKHSRLREIPIPKKDGTQRMLKVPTIADRAWQCLVKYAVEPAHEALFHARSYGFRPGRSAHNAQKHLFDNLNSRVNGLKKRILELDIEKCFDRINHNTILESTIAPRSIKLGLWKCLKTGINPEFPEQGTPQGGVISPLLANIALNGIEEIHNSVRYADDMVFILKPSDDAEKILAEVEEFLAQRGLKIKSSKTKLVKATDGFDFLGWHFKVQSNGKFRSYPSKDNFDAFRKKVKAIVNCSNYGARVKAKKLAPLVRGWRNYHKFCKLDRKHSLWHLSHRTWQVFNKEGKLNRYQVNDLIKKAFPTVSFAENKHVNVKGDYSPYNGDLIYWSERNSKLYDNATSKALKKQNHTCDYCNLKFLSDERVHLHHIDGDHDNWKSKNLIVVHESCHDYTHMSKLEHRKLDAVKAARPDLTERGEV